MGTNIVAFANSCVPRQIDLDDEYEFFIFDLYWNHLIPRVTGQGGWDEGIRHYTIMSEAKNPVYPELELFTVSNEAFLCVLWDNNADKWQLHQRYLDAHPGEKLPNRKKKHEADENAHLHKAKYTSQANGQKRTGTWHSEGIKRFNEYFHAITEARKRPQYLEVERKYLEMKRQLLGIVGQNQ